MGATIQSIVFGSHASWFDVAQLVTAVLSVGMAAGAVFYTTRESRRNQARTELTYSPILISEKIEGAERDQLGIRVLNVGTGPALIDAIYIEVREISVRIDGRPAWTDTLFANLQESYFEQFPRGLKVDIHPTKARKGSVLGADKEFWICNRSKGALNKIPESVFAGLIREAKIRIFYHSIHGRQFCTDYGYDPEGNVPEGQWDDGIIRLDPSE